MTRTEEEMARGARSMTHVEVVLEALGIEIASRRGGRGWCLCPWHSDHTPSSFFVRLRGPRAGQHHCFACKNGGGLVDLVMRVRGCDRDAAVAFVKLAGERYEPPRKAVRVVERAPVLGRARFAMPREVIFEPLAEWVTPARRAAEERGLTQGEVEAYRIGYAVDGRLAGRIVIPWLDGAQRAAGYSARTFCGEEPKYQTPRPDEGADRTVMFGEHLWPATHRRAVVVTEGAFNGIAVRRAYDVPVAALGGSEIDPLHVVKLATFARVVILTDPDAAGDKAAAALERALGRHVVAQRVRLPPKKDALELQLKLGVDVLRAFLHPALSGATSAP